jgi:hypothetical protein
VIDARSHLSRWQFLAEVPVVFRLQYKAITNKYMLMARCRHPDSITHPSGSMLLKSTIVKHHKVQSKHAHSKTYQTTTTQQMTPFTPFKMH